MCFLLSSPLFQLLSLLFLAPLSCFLLLSPPHLLLSPSTLFFSLIWASLALGLSTVFRLLALFLPLLVTSSDFRVSDQEPPCMSKDYETPQSLVWISKMHSPRHKCLMNTFKWAALETCLIMYQVLWDPWYRWALGLYLPWEAGIKPMPQKRKINSTQWI